MWIAQIFMILAMSDKFNLIEKKSIIRLTCWSKFHCDSTLINPNSNPGSQFYSAVYARRSLLSQAFSLACGHYLLFLADVHLDMIL